MDEHRSFLTRLQSGFAAFRQEFQKSSLQDKDPEFPKWEARRLRYEMFWAFYENTQFNHRIHDWSHKYKTDYGLYRYIRGIYNPAYRLGEFYKTHMLGGRMDPEAGEGKRKPTAIPIIIPEENQANAERLRQAIAQIWAWWDLQRHKDILSLWGATLGDAFIMINDDTDRQRVYPQHIHPGKIQWLELDDRDNIRGYRLSEWRRDPENPLHMVSYAEEATRVDDVVEYTTYRNNQPYAWNEDLGESWSVPYGFVPLVQIKHNDVGVDWGWSELHAAWGKFQEIDDLASKFHDHVRKGVDPPWFLSGVSKQKAERALEQEGEETDPTGDRPQPGREEIIAIYANNPQARAQAMLAELDMLAVVKNIEQLLEELEKDYPELAQDEKSALASNSSKAIRAARQKAERKVHQRRQNYDSGIVRAQQMAISIAAWRRYDGFDGFDLYSFAEGALEHSIGDRPVFNRDPLDTLELDEKFWTVAESAVPFIGLRNYLEQAQWDDDDIDAAVAAHEEQQAKDREAQSAGEMSADGRAPQNREFDRQEE